MTSNYSERERGREKSENTQFTRTHIIYTSTFTILKQENG